MPDGVVIVDKPAGMTSHDVVDEVRRRFATRKVGHGGTLDPDATGVLVLGLGKATRFLDYSQATPKRYQAHAVFGITTSTQDASGEVRERSEVPVERATLSEVLADLTGVLEQVPPMVSAVRIGGERLYEKARRGEEITRAARPVTIHSLELTGFSGREASFDVLCSAGTYIRTLVHDIGQVLGCGAHLKTLRRTEAGGFDIEDAVPLADLAARDLKPLSAAVRGMPRMDLDRACALMVSRGRPIDGGDTRAEEDERVALLHDGLLVAVYRRSHDRLVAERVVPS
ncbi:MAG: tRNA pseudouridine(55) synthase TruB [Actinobacteria bacterium]|nr:tRNA pseudouridine(55) synthase TruB [Actinomycetota bacterium]